MTAAVLSEVGRSEAGGTSQCGVMPLSPEEVGRRIEAARKEKRWSRLDLATAFDVSPSSVYRWENGKLPGVAVLLALSRLLGKPDDYLTEPPEQRLALADLHDLLEEARDEAERGRSALLESLVSIDARLSAIEQLLGAPAAQGNQT